MYEKNQDSQGEEQQQQEPAVLAAHREEPVAAPEEDYLDNPISTITALTHPELVENAKDRYNDYSYEWAGNKFNFDHYNSDDANTLFKISLAINKHLT